MINFGLTLSYFNLYEHIYFYLSRSIKMMFNQAILQANPPQYLQNVQDTTKHSIYIFVYIA